MLKFFGPTNIKIHVAAVLKGMHKKLNGMSVIDMPAGSGYTSNILKEHGATVIAYDLFPEFFEAEGIKCSKIDLSEKLPIDDNSADMIVCQEGIEHLPNQLLLFKEFSRILEEKGTLILTTPNISHLRAKLSYFMSESDFYKRMPPNELDALWHTADGRQYFGHIFLLGIQKIRVLAAISGLKIKKVHTVKVSIGSFSLLFVYPLLILANVYSYAKNLYKYDGVNFNEKKKIYREIIKLNLHPTILFGKHLLLELEKDEQSKLDVRNSKDGII